MLNTLENYFEKAPQNKKIQLDLIEDLVNNSFNKQKLISKSKNKKQLTNKMENNKLENPKYTMVETFVGCGGAHLGFKNNGFRSLLVNDIDENMIKTLIQNKMVNESQCLTCSIEDITPDIMREKIKEDVDVLFGGIVCKGFSMAGVRNPFDKRNYLYKSQLKLVEQIRPKVSVIENVIGLKNMMLYKKNKTTQSIFKKFNKLNDVNKKLNGIKSAKRKQGEPYDDLNKQILDNKKNMKVMLDHISKFKYSIHEDICNIYEKLGYKVYSKVLVAGNYNGYTTRKRLIIVAVRNDIEKVYEFPEEEKSYNLIDALRKIDYENANSTENDVDNRPMNHNEKTVRRFKFIPEGKNIADIIDTLPDDLKISKFYSRGNTQRLDRNKQCPTLVPGHSNFPIHPEEHRSITVREAATITGFPLDYKFYGSHTSRCMQIGNAVPVYLADAIAKSIKKIL